jgi:hypothetical protein
MMSKIFRAVTHGFPTQPAAIAHRIRPTNGAVHHVTIQEIEGQTAISFDVELEWYTFLRNATR